MPPTQWVVSTVITTGNGSNLHMGFLKLYTREHSLVPTTAFMVQITIGFSNSIVKDIGLLWNIRRGVKEMNIATNIAAVPNLITMLSAQLPERRACEMPVKSPNPLQSTSQLVNRSTSQLIKPGLLD